MSFDSALLERKSDNADIFLKTALVMRGVRLSAKISTNGAAKNVGSLS
jgi:hypothetical protein